MKRTSRGSRDGSRFTGQYAEDGKAKRLAVRAEAGHRCIRCRHPFETGKHGKGEWSPCDEFCAHKGPGRIWIISDDEGEDAHWMKLELSIPAGKQVTCGVNVEAQWRILTVHHLDGQKDNDAWWNLLSLCQRCHLEIQGKVDPRIPWFLEHSTWFKPYAAGFYAKKYLGTDITRAEAMARLDELLALEHKV